MRSQLCSLCCCVILMGVSSHASANMVAVDLDPSTPVVPDGGVYVGLDDTFTTTSGSTITADVYFLPDLSTGGPPNVSAFGFDLNWGLATDSAALSLTSLVAGPVANGGSFGLGSNDIVSDTPGVLALTTLTPGSVAPLAGYAQNVGGAGYYDATSNSFSIAGSSFVPLLIARTQFLVSGQPGDSVTIDPSTGVLNSNDTPFSLGQNTNFIVGPLDGMSYPGTPAGGVVSVAIPEPGSFMLVGVAATLTGIGIVWRRRGRRLAAG